LSQPEKYRDLVPPRTSRRRGPLRVVTRTATRRRWDYPVATPVRTWHATQCPGEICFRTCSFCEHDGTRRPQRVWNRQPDGGLIGLGTSPSRMIRFRFTVGSGMGTAESSASVYGCLGLVYSSLAGPISTI